MRRLQLLIFLTLTMASLSGAEPYWQQSVAYTIDVTLDPETHTLTGQETIVYRNQSPDTLHNIYLHLYPNAFRDEQTTFLKEERRFYTFNFRKLPEKNRGSIDITEFRINEAPADFSVQETILRTDLTEGLAPGTELVVTLSFVERVREKYDRAGYVGRHYDFGQWYPKVVVYDEKGWHPDPFHCEGEFYGEFGTYDVTITIPDDYVIAATGECTGGDPGWEKHLSDSTTSEPMWQEEDEDAGKRVNKSVSFRAERVHDFAWCADPDYVVQDTVWNGITIRSFYRQWNSDWADTNLAYGLSAIQWLEEKVGPYPYPQVSVVDVPWGGGMEYPMLVMNGFLDESLVLHEVSHMYFYGILANNELDEAWLDEGFATFMEQWYMKTAYGPYGKESHRDWYERLLPRMTRREGDISWLLDLAREREWEKVAMSAHEFKNGPWSMVYGKAAEFLWMLKYLAGDVVFDRIMRTYYDEWQFRHVNEARFREVCERVSGQDLDWFFEQWLHTTKLCDYAVQNVETEWSWEKATRIYRTSVVVRRLGNIIMPVEVHLELADGTAMVKRLEGRLIEERVSFQADEEPKGVSLNPGNEILDINMLNNHRPWKTRWAADLPNMEYRPQDAYLIRHKPLIWYNSVDRLRMGWQCRGSYAEKYSQWTAGFCFGFKSERLDMMFSGSTPLKGLGTYSTGGLEVNKMEGRLQAGAYLKKAFPKYAGRPLLSLAIGLDHLEVRDWRYVSAGEWEGGKVDKLYMGLSASPSADIFSSHIDLQAATAGRRTGSDHEFSSVRGELSLKTEHKRHHAALRMFLGWASPGVPLQERFYLAGAGPIDRFKRFYLRSRGSLPEELNYHLGGDGNLRGYLECGLGAKRLMAVNAEYRFPYGAPDWLGVLSRYTGIRYRFVVFSDIGKVLDSDRPAILANALLYDLGVGLRLRRETSPGTIRLRLDFPFYVNRPSLNGENDTFDFRWLVSLEEIF